MTPIDPRAWNLFGAVALVAGGCGALAGEGNSNSGSNSGTSTTVTDSNDGYGHYHHCFEGTTEEERAGCPGYHYNGYHGYNPDDCGAHDECGTAELCIDYECQLVGQELLPCPDELAWSSIPLPPETGGAVYQLSAIDLDGDAMIDLAARRDLDLLTVRSADDLVASVPLAPYQQPVAMSAASLDAAVPDGLAMLDTGSNQMQFFPNDGLGALSAPVALGQSQSDGSANLVAGDFDGDGNIDLAHGSTIIYGDGLGGTTGTGSIPLVHLDTSLATTQTDMDAAHELLGVDDEMRVPATWDTDNGTSLLALDNEAAAITSAVAVDLTNAGADDGFIVATVSPNYNFISVLRPLADPQGIIEYGSPMGHVRHAVADLEGDGRPELIGFGGPLQEIIIYRDLANGAEACISVAPFPGPELAIGDFDGDGDDDLIVPQQGNGQMMRYSLQ